MAKPSPSPSAYPIVINNKTLHSVWTVPLAGGTPRKLADLADRPRWSPDGNRIFFTGASSGTSQIWSMNTDGSGAAQLTRLSTEASGELVSPDGKYLVVTSEVYPECGADDACNAKHLDADTHSNVQARLITACFTGTGPPGRARPAAICFRYRSPTAKWWIFPLEIKWCRLSPWEARTITQSRPTAAKFASP
jgi:dipeptidyl aminopeptidase/acylaminoacyl peptidase